MSNMLFEHAVMFIYMHKSKNVAHVCAVCAMFKARNSLKTKKILPEVMEHSSVTNTHILLTAQPIIFEMRQGVTMERVIGVSWFL